MEQQNTIGSKIRTWAFIAWYLELAGVVIISLVCFMAEIGDLAVYIISATLVGLLLFYVGYLLCKGFADLIDDTAAIRHLLEKGISTNTVDSSDDSANIIELNNYAELLKSGAITQEEFDKVKSQLMK